MLSRVAIFRRVGAHRSGPLNPDDPEPDGFPDDLITEPLRPTVLDRAVVVIGPGPIALAMTADAAEISGLRLLDAAARAREDY